MHGDLTLLNSRSLEVLKGFAVPVQHNLKLNSMDLYSFALV